MRVNAFAAFPGALIALAVCFAARAGTYYKWTDPHDTVHYSQTSPPDQAAKTVHVSDDAPSTPPLKPLPNAPANAVASAPAGQRALRKIDAEAIHNNCIIARRNVVRLQHRRLLVDSNDPDNAHALSPEQRQHALADAGRQIAQYCGKP